MPRRRLSVLAPLVLAACAATATAAPAEDARALVDSVAARYGTLAHYRFEGLLSARASGPSMPNAQVLDVPFRYAAVRPSKLHHDARNPYMPSRVVADGESLWVSAPALGQYTVQKAPAFVPGGPADETARMFDPALAMAAGLGAGLRGARFLGDDTVHTAAGPVTCRRVELTFAPDTTQTQARALPRVLWIDVSRALVLRDSNTTDIAHAQFGELRQVQDVRYVVADIAGPGDESLFRFEPPADARRVRRIGPQAANEPDDAGKVATDFSLAVLDGKGRKESLAAHRGKVVVLDFWATWCGPCRRWMPIVEKVGKEAAKKDVKVFAVNVREPAPLVRSYVKAQKVEVPVLLDSDGAIGAAYGARSIPLTVIVGRDGRIVRTLLGLHPEEDLRDALREAGVEGI